MPARLLIVDDDPSMLEVLAAMVEIRLIDVAIATCSPPGEALERIAETDYDAIVSDVKMPGMDGFQLMEQVLQIRPTTPTLLVTGHGDHDMGVKALKSGAYAFIPKPIEREFFLAWLKRAIQLRQLTRVVEKQNVTLEQTVQERTAALERTNLELKEAGQNLRIRGIDERKRRATLGERETQLKLITDTAPVFIAHCDREGGYKFVNQGCAEHLGVSPEDCIGKHMQHIVDMQAYKCMSMPRCPAG